MNETGQGKRAPVSRIDDLTIKVFADSADLDGMLTMYAAPRITGFTTNPPLMCKQGLPPRGLLQILFWNVPPIDRNRSRSLPTISTA